MLDAAATARKWLQDASLKAEEASASGLGEDAFWHGGFFNAVNLTGLRVHRTGEGRAICSFRVPQHLTDADGNWQAGAIAAAIDDVGAAAIMSTEGIIKVSVEFDISYFSPAKFDEEVEIDGSIVVRKGRLTAVTVEIRKKWTGELVAVGRQWMTSSRPFSTQRSKL